VLLQMLRGAGLKGLSAMPMCRAWCGGWHLRPLLHVPQRALREFCEVAGIAAVADPMNLDMRFDRAYLRKHLWPLIEKRWPGRRSPCRARHSTPRMHKSCWTSRRRLRRKSCATARRCRWTGLRALSVAEQRNTLRYWIAAHALEVPSNRALERGVAADHGSGRGSLACRRLGRPCAAAFTGTGCT